MPALTDTIPAFRLPEIEPARIATLVDRLGITPTLAQLLLARSIDTSDALKNYLKPQWTAEPSATLFHNGAALIARLVAAIRAQEPILVHGDYDVDGICGSVIYHRGLSVLGARVRGYLPSRFVDGYGVSLSAIASAKEAGVRVLLTADTGSQAYAAMDAADEAGIDLCITDHHTLGERLPATPWFINPMQAGCPYPYKGLSGGGIALKVVLAVAEALGTPLDADTLVPYATLSTIADVCPLTGENRALVDRGLTLLQRPRDPGLRLLIDAARKPGQTLSARDLAFQVIPLLNAAGRIDHPRAAAQLLLTDSATQAREKHADLVRLNNERRRITETVFEQAAQQAEQELSRHSDLTALVVAAPQWHFGVVGIVAARLVDRYARPVICLTQHQEQQRKGPDAGPYLYTGSGRAPAGIALLTAVKMCHDELEHCGGHEAALGIGLRVESLTRFRERLSEAVASLPSTQSAGGRTLDGQLAPSAVTPRLIAELARVEPCGAGNPSPAFLIGPVTIEEEAGMKGNAHRTLTVRDAEGNPWRAVQFGVAPKTPVPEGQVGLIGMPVRNDWRGKRSIEFQVEDVVSWPGEN